MINIIVLFVVRFSFSSALSLKPSAHVFEFPEPTNKIPQLIWVTGEWQPGSEEVSQIEGNLGIPTLHKKLNSDSSQLQVEQMFGKWIPIGSKIRYFTDQDMDESVRNISKMLDARGIRGADEAYFNLRPGAFRADIWRLMVLWAEGGVYLDANLNLKNKLEDWIDFSNDELVLVRDVVPRRFHHEKAFWNAMMAAAPQNEYIENALKDIVNHVHEHYYGQNPLSITGPFAVGYSITHQPNFPEHLRIDLFKKGNNVFNKKGVVVATKVKDMHFSYDPSKHYDPLWRNRQVYCDQAGPQIDRGKCAAQSKDEIEPPFWPD